jgi:flagellar hook assembly protein FlgD
VTLEIFNASGALVRRLLVGDRPAGRFSIRWDSRDDGGHVVPAGVYMIRMKTSDGDRTWRVVLAK